MNKLSYLQLRVTNVKLKNTNLHLKLLTGKLKKKILYTLYFILYFIEIWKERRLKDCSSSTCDLLITHPDFKPMELYPCRLKSGINFGLEPEWVYIRVGLYSSDR